MTSTANQSGISNGTVKWRWSETDAASANTRFLFELKFDNAANNFWSTELYQYNSNGGYIEPFGQNKFVDDTECTPTCSTSGVSTSFAAMPPLDPSLVGQSGTSVTGVAYTQAGFFSSASPGNTYTCASFTPRYAGVVETFTATKTAGGAISICGFVINDQCTPVVRRTFTLSGFTRGVPTITPPPGCKCDSVLDVMIVLDSSGSITPVQTKQFRDFVINFLKGLTISPNNVNVGLVWFGRAVGTLIPGLSNSATDIAKAVSNCTGSSTTIGGCATPAGTIVPWETPCNTADGITTSRCPNDVPLTCTGAGVLVGAANLFSSSSNRKVPKLFITMTDGAVNRLVTGWDVTKPWTSTSTYPSCGDSCAILSNTDGQNCTRQLKTIMQTVKTQHSNWLTSVGCSAAQCPLTFISVGIGLEFFKYCDPASPQTQNYVDPWQGNINWISSNCRYNSSSNPRMLTCQESNRCLSPQTLDVLAAGNGAAGNVNPNVLQASDWVKLNNEFLPKLLSLSCPNNDFTACQCLQNCGGYCSGACNECNPPQRCPPENNKCYTVSPTPIGGKCPKVLTQNPCPARSENCTHVTTWTCVSTAASGAGDCVPTYTANTKPCDTIYVGTPPQASCRVARCNAASGKCDIIDTSACPPCQNITGECTGASCNPPKNGVRTYTQVSTGVDFCNGAGNTYNETCCFPCDCAVGEWSDWNSTCSGDCTTAVEVISRNRTINGSFCGGNSELCNVPTTETFNCANCTVTDCDFTWGSWSCECSTGTAVRPVIIRASPTNGGAVCPNQTEDTCVCCQSEWTSTNCSCDTHTYNRWWNITTNAVGPGAQACETPETTEYLNQPCDPVGDNCTICATAEDCDDGNACTEDICDDNGGTTEKNHCRYTNITSTCEVPSACTLGYCDPDVGCRTQPKLLCDDNNVCTNDWCDDVQGCMHNASEIALNCSAPTDCNFAYCDPFGGCNFAGIVCNSTDNCSIAGCDPDWNSTDPDYEPLCKCEKPTGPCYEYEVCGTDIGVIIGLTAGGIAALVVCLAFLAFLILSGGTYALATQVRSHEDTNMNNNPLYQDKGTHGTNVFHAGNVD